MVPKMFEPLKFDCIYYSLLPADGYYETVLVLPEGSRDIAISESFQSPHFLGEFITAVTSVRKINEIQISM